MSQRRSDSHRAVAPQEHADLDEMRELRASTMYAMTALPVDIQRIDWAAEQLGIGESTAYRLAEAGQLPGAFKVGRQWRVSVPRFLREVHGEQVAS